MSRQQLLQRIISTSQKLKSSLAARQLSTDVQPPPSNDNPPPAIPPLRLQERTANFQADLHKYGILPQIREVASGRAEELATHYQQSYERMCNNLVSSPGSSHDRIADILQRLRDNFESLYEEKDLRSFLDSARRIQGNLVNVKTQSLLPVSTDRRPVFNHEFTPVLEAYFGINAYPVASDRRSLACETNMTPRQIEVWFQNHRNRAKKEGKRLIRGSSEIALKHAMHCTQKTGNSSQPSDRRSVLTSLSDEESCDEMDEPSSPLASPFSFDGYRPAHAFPTSYPPVSSEDPFPNPNGPFKFAPPVWSRCTSNIPIRSSVVTVDELTTLFASKLNLREGSSGPAKRKQAALSSERWFNARITTPSSAPHPALIRSACSNHNNTFVQPPSLSSSFTPSPRKLTPLPKRQPSTSFPNYPNLFTSHLYTRTESRLSSVSGLSSRSRTTSSSSVSSLEPMTPPPLPTLNLSSSYDNVEDEFRIFGEYFGNISDHVEDLASPNLDHLTAHKHPMLAYDSLFPLPSLHPIEAQ